jgi:hypothetical protein
MEDLSYRAYLNQAARLPNVNPINRMNPINTTNPINNNLKISSTSSAANEHFALNKVQFSWRSELVALAVRNNWLVMGLADLKILRIDLLQPQRIDGLSLCY